MSKEERDEQFRRELQRASERIFCAFIVADYQYSNDELRNMAVIQAAKLLKQTHAYCEDLDESIG